MAEGGCNGIGKGSTGTLLSLLLGGKGKVLRDGAVCKGGSRGELVLLWIEDGDCIGKGPLGSNGTRRVKHNLDLDTEDTLSEEHVADGIVDVVLGGLSRVDEQTVGELHRLCALSAELSRDDDLATLGTRVHDELDDTVAGTAGWQS